MLVIDNILLHMRSLLHILIGSFVVLIIIMGCGSDNGHSMVTTLDGAKPPLFQLVSNDKSHITFTNQLVENDRINILNYLYYYNGSGVAVGDINNDGLPDLYFGSSVGKNKLYLNKGNLVFEDISARAGVEGEYGITTGVSFIDVNQDGYVDIYICKSGSHTEQYRTNELLINHGDLTFSEQAALFGLDDHSFSSQAYFFDVDQDADLDMYLVNHPIDWPNINKIMTGDQILDGFDYQFSDKLYKNESGKYRDVTKAAGLINRSWGLSAAIGDFNDDQLPDIYVANDFIKPDYLYINNGDGTFTDQILNFFRHISFFSMGSDFADIDNDGRRDLFVADMAMPSHQKSKRNMGSMSSEDFKTIVRRDHHYPYSINTLQYNIGGNEFVDISQAAGVDKTDWSWAPLLADFDNDGFKDLFITNGIYRDIIDNDFLLKKSEYDAQENKKYVTDLLPLIPQSEVHNRIFRNNGDLTFLDLSAPWGLATPSNSNGAAYADLDNDGDLDLIINNLNEPSALFENKSDQLLAHQFAKIKLIGPAENISAIGAEVMLYHDGHIQRRDMYTHRGYYSSIDQVLHFGIGSSPRIDSIIVTWPDGLITKQVRPKINTLLTISHKRSVKNKDRPTAQSSPYFTDITARSGLAHLHTEKEFDDFAEELLLPHRLSQLGPIISVADVDGDGLEDFFIGGASGAAGALYIQQTEGQFTAHSKVTWGPDRAYEDMGSCFVDFDDDGDLDLYVVSGCNEFKDPTAYQDRLYENDGKGYFKKTAGKLPLITHSGSSVCSFDADGDGDADLVIGGRVTPGKYPLSPKSYLLENVGGVFQDATSRIAPALAGIGMVTAIKTSDIDQDGDADLVIAGEWMAITILENHQGEFKESTVERGLEDTEGWWQSIAILDIDKDGDEDIIAGNIGNNNKYKPTVEKPLRVFYADFDQNGHGDIVLSKQEDEELLPVRGRECSSQQMPFISDKFPDYSSYASASLIDIYSHDKIDNAFQLKAVEFRSHILLNQGDGTYEKRPLPSYAQISPINAILAQDYNGDKYTDLILAGNMLTSETETVRYDAGHGLVLQGRADGGHTPVRPLQSGLHLQGDVKDLALIKLGEDTLGILVAKNDDQLQLIKMKRHDSL